MHSLCFLSVQGLRQGSAFVRWEQSRPLCSSSKGSLEESTVRRAARQAGQGGVSGLGNLWVNGDGAPLTLFLGTAFYVLFMRVMSMKASASFLVLQSHAYEPATEPMSNQLFFPASEIVQRKILLQRLLGIVRESV